MRRDRDVARWSFTKRGETAIMGCHGHGQLSNFFSGSPNGDGESECIRVKMKFTDSSEDLLKSL